MIYLSSVLDPFRLRLHSTAPWRVTESARLFGYSRQALETGLQLLGIKAGERVLLPDFICDVVMVPFHRLGIEVDFYPLDDQLTPLFDEVEKRIRSTTRALLVPNYFGFPQPWERIRELCDARALWYIEDNAGGFLSRAGQRPLGSFGDISVTSVWKTLPARNGAILGVNHPIAKHALEQLAAVAPQAFESGSARHYVKRLARWLDIATPLPLSGLRQARPEAPEPGSGEDATAPYAMDRGGRWLLNHYDLHGEAERRRSHYEAWLAKLSASKAALLFPTLCAGTVPLALPVYIEDQGPWLRWGSDHGVEIRTWPTLPARVSARVPAAVRRRERMLLLPLNAVPRASALLALPGS